MDFSIFDVLLDSIIVVDNNYNVVYCNEVAADLCESSVRRMTKGKSINEFILFKDENLFLYGKGDRGKTEPVPLEEIDFELVKGEKSGKVQMAIRPFDGGEGTHWVVFIRDVTLEEVLHGKYRAQLEQLENYSKNLEKMVEERTAELKSANSLLAAIMDSLGQGFLVFDKDGNCSDIYTKACEEILEESPANKNIVTVLNCTGHDKEQFEMWLQAVFSQSLPFDSLKDLAPNLYNHSQGKHVILDYFSITSEEDGSISNIVLVATDKTAEFEAQKALDKEKKFAKMVVKLVSGRKQFGTYWFGLDKHLNSIKEAISKGEPDLDFVFRVLHTIEGESGSFYVSGLQEVSRNLQEIIGPVRSGDLSSFSEVKDKFNEELVRFYDERKQFESKNEELLKLISISDENLVEVNSYKLKEYVGLFSKNGAPEDLCKQFIEEFVLQPIGPSVKFYNGLVQQVAAKLGKSIEEIEVVGETIKFDLDLYESFLASLVHVFRNVVDHGIETPEARQEVGKPDSGKIVVSCNAEASGEGRIIKISIKDDGRGIDPQVIKTKMTENGYGEVLEGKSDHDIIQHIFDPGFTSRSEATEFSGRGVGMDSVKSEVSKLGGKIEVFTELNKGTELKIEIPEVYKNWKLDEVA